MGSLSTKGHLVLRDCLSSHTRMSPKDHRLNQENRQREFKRGVWAQLQLGSRGTTQHKCAPIKGRDGTGRHYRFFMNALGGRSYFTDSQAKSQRARPRGPKSEMKSICVTHSYLNPFPSQKNQGLRGMKEVPKAQRPLCLEALGERAGRSLTAAIGRKGMLGLERVPPPHPTHTHFGAE